MSAENQKEAFVKAMRKKELRQKIMERRDLRAASSIAALINLQLGIDDLPQDRIVSETMEISGHTGELWANRAKPRSWILPTNFQEIRLKDPITLTLSAEPEKKWREKRDFYFIPYPWPRYQPSRYIVELQAGFASSEFPEDAKFTHILTIPRKGYPKLVTFEPTFIKSDNNDVPPQLNHYLVHSADIGELTITRLYPLLQKLTQAPVSIK